MRLIVCGSAPRQARSGLSAARIAGWTDEALLREVLDELFAEAWKLDPDGTFTVVEGEAAGADYMAARWAETRADVVCEPHPADWDEHGRGAGPIRNLAMAKAGADLVVAFSVFWPPVGGTLDMCEVADRRGIPVLVVTPDGERRDFDRQAVAR